MHRVRAFELGLMMLNIEKPRQPIDLSQRYRTARGRRVPYIEQMDEDHQEKRASKTQKDCEIQPVSAIDTEFCFKDLTLSRRAIVITRSRVRRDLRESTDSQIF